MPKSAFPYPGGKSRHADWIVRHFPDHHCYIEPFGGSGGVLLNKPRSSVEIYNDLNGDIVHFFQTLRDCPLELEAFLKKTPYSRELYEEYATAYYNGERPADDIERAGRFFYLRFAQFGGKIADKAGFAVSTARSRATPYDGGLERLESVAERFRGVVIENMDWSELVTRRDREDVLFYFDPPYVGTGYQYDTGGFNHSEFVETLHGLDGDWVVSYEDLPKGMGRYHMEETETTYSMGSGQNGGRKEMTERLVMNFDPEQTASFSEANQSALTAYK